MRLWNGPQFTHVSVDDFRIIRDNLAGGARSTQDRLVPYCVFTDPPLAHIGLHERDAQQQGIAVRVGKLPMTAVLRRQATDEVLGFMKVVVSAGDDRILGFTMLGADAGEIMAAVQTAMLAGLPCAKLRDAVIAHLTTAEGFGPVISERAIALTVRRRLQRAGCPTKLRLSAACPKRSAPTSPLSPGAALANRKSWRDHFGMTVDDL